MARSHVTDKDRGYKKAIKAIKEIDATGLSVGIHAAEGAEAKKTPEGKDDEVTVLMVGIWQEFGTGRIPARSFLRAWFDEHEKEAKEKWVALHRAAVLKRNPTKAAAELFGLWVVGQIQKRIADNIPPPLAQSTIDRKGSSVALINTGQLRTSITHKVET